MKKLAALLICLSIDWNGQGPVDTWVAQWATDSMHVSGNHAHKSVKILRKRTVTSTRDGITQTKTVYDIKRAVNYNTVNVPVVRDLTNNVSCP